jgi:hypothetical protein
MAVLSVDARLERVTVYASGARVRRVAELAGPIPARVRIAGLPVAVMDDTVRVEVDGPAVATNVRTGVEAAEEAAAAAEEPAELRAARHRAALAAADVERLRAALDALGRAPLIEADPTDEEPAPWTDVVAARRAVIALRAERELALRDQLAAARRALEEAQRIAEAAADRDRRAGTAREAKLHELRKYVEVELVPSGEGALAIHLEYLVGAARWAPSYVARLEPDRATVEVRAVVAQDTGEDWTGVPLSLSTAEPSRFAALPELAAQRIGRRQQESARAGFRAPPTGAEALFADYDRDRRRTCGEPPRPARAPRVVGERSQYEDGTYLGQPPAPADAKPLADEVWDDETSRAKEAYDTPAEGFLRMSLPDTGVAPQPEQAPARNRHETSVGSKKRASARETAKVPAPPPAAAAPAMPRGGFAAQSTPAPTTVMVSQAFALGGAAPGYAGGSPLAPPPPPPPPAARLDYGNLRMAPPSSPSRGRLVPAPADRHAADAEHETFTRQVKLAALALPPGCAAGWLHTYDYAFATDGAVEVRADGAWHSIAVTSQVSTVKVRHVAVPREQADVFRLASVANPFAGPLLPGPIDVYDRGRFLVTSSVDYTPPGAEVEIGLGVDPAVKIARNTEFREEVGGMLRGALKLIHTIAIDIENLSSRPIDVEVRERVPVVREGDDEMEITMGRADPPWERWTPEAEGPGARRLRGGHRWRVQVPASQKRTLRAGYEVKISGKLELVGGNRRES